MGDDLVDCNIGDDGLLLITLANFGPSWFRMDELIDPRLNVALRLWLDPPPIEPLFPENSSAFMGEKFPNLPDEFKNCSTAFDVFVFLNVFLRRFMVLAEAVRLSYASLTCHV